jgi:hypothetical protein
MSNKETKQRAENVRHYLAGIGQEISQSQAYEVVARALGHKNKHTLAAAEAGDDGKTSTGTTTASSVSEQTLKVFQIGERPFTAKELALRGFDVDVVVPLDMSTVQSDDIEGMNDHASELITGSICGLVDIGYKVYPHFYGPDYIAMRVTGYVDAVGELGLDETGEALLAQMPEKQRLAKALKLKRGARLELCWALDVAGPVIVDFVDPELVDALANSADFVGEDGVVLETYESLRHRTVLSVSPLDAIRPEHKFDITLEELMFAQYQDNDWHVDIFTDEGRLTYRFKFI